MIKYLKDKWGLFWLNRKFDRVLKNLPKSGICPYCGEAVNNATSWASGKPCHDRCWAENGWGD